MILARMLQVDRDALICDLAETYHIFDYRALPVKLLATLSCGLKADSRTKRRLAGIREVSVCEILATIADNLTVIRHVLLSDKNLNKNELFSVLMIEHETTGNVVFETGEDFMEWRNKIVGGSDDG